MKRKTLRRWSPSKLTQERVRALLDYDPRTGVFTWRERTVEMFEAPERVRGGEKRKRLTTNGALRNQRSWNAKHAGKPALDTPRDKTVGGQYLYGMIEGEQHVAHRVAFLWMIGVWPKEPRHANEDGTDNRWENLRDAKATDELIAA